MKPEDYQKLSRPTNLPMQPYPSAPTARDNPRWETELRRLTRLMIDSRNGYDKLSEIFSEHAALSQNLKLMRDQRTALCAKLQNFFRREKRSVPRAGTRMGAVHRGFTYFARLHDDDPPRAFEALAMSDQALQNEIVQLCQDAAATDGEPWPCAAVLKDCDDALRALHWRAQSPR